MLVSVIIPCHNVAPFIRECVESVVAQSYGHIEIICIENNSSDTTWKELQDLKREFPFLILESQSAPGAPAARNKGLSLSRGEWIQFLDADDLLSPEKIAHQVKLLSDADQSVGFVAGAYKKRDLQKKEILFDRIDLNPLTTLFHNKAGITSSNLWRRSALVSVGGWSENLRSSQEADLMMKLVLGGWKLMGDKVPNTVIRERVSGQISQSDPATRWETYIDVYENFTREIKSRFPAEYGKYRSFYFEAMLFSVLILASYDRKKAEIIYDRLKRFFGYLKPEFKLRYFRSMAVRLVGLRFWTRLSAIEMKVSA